MEIAEPMKQDNKFLPHFGPTGSLRPPCRQKFNTGTGNRVVYTGKGFRRQGKVVVYTGTNIPSSAGGLPDGGANAGSNCSLRSPSVRFMFVLVVIVRELGAQLC